MLNNAGLLKCMLAATLAMQLVACTQNYARIDTHEALNATLWIQTSAEYAASTLQAYHLAAANLDQALADQQWTAALEQDGDYADLPPAVILDLDQTVLDVSRYNTRIILQLGSHVRGKFAAWCSQVAAPAIPGVKDFVEHAVASGVSIFYISSRHESIRDCTVRNIQSLELPLPGQERLLLNDGTPATSKTRHRSNVASQYRILLLVGDNLDDFSADSRKDPATRRALVSHHAARWGREWIILPNPMYGTWETSLYGFDYALPRNERLQLKARHLEQ